MYTKRVGESFRRSVFALISNFKQNISFCGRPPKMSRLLLCDPEIQNKQLAPRIEALYVWHSPLNKLRGNVRSPKVGNFITVYNFWRKFYEEYATIAYFVVYIKVNIERNKNCIKNENVYIQCFTHFLVLKSYTESFMNYY